MRYIKICKKVLNEEKYLKYHSYSKKINKAPKYNKIH